MSKKSIGDIISEADYNSVVKDIALQIGTTLKTKNLNLVERREVAMFCIAEAHKKLNIPMDPLLIAREVGSPDVSLDTATLKCLKRNVGSYAGTGSTNHSDVLACLAGAIYNDEFVRREIIPEFEFLFRKDVDLSEKPTRTIAAAFLWYYMTKNGAIMSKKEYCSDNGVKIATLDSLCRRIDKLYST